MTLMGWLWIGPSVLAAFVLAAVVWLGGPLVDFGETQPFDGVLTRLLIIAVIFPDRSRNHRLADCHPSPRHRQDREGDDGGSARGERRPDTQAKDGGGARYP